MAEELKPCPFCGGQGVVDTQERFPDGPDNLAYFVSCIQCACQGPWMKSEGSAIKFWNMRIEEIIKET